MLQTLATAGIPDALGSAGTGTSVWQSIGGLVAVFGLLLISMKLLVKFNRRGSSGETDMLAVWPLGPKREIQILRLATEVHYIYRHEGAMVLLKQGTLEEWETLNQQEAQKGTNPDLGIGALLKRAIPFANITGPASSPKAQLP